MSTPPDDEGLRPTTLGEYSLAQQGTSRARAVPVPWVDCLACAWRHYPITSAGRWHIATACASCGKPLAVPGAPDSGIAGNREET
jgi:hypothetical protein